MIPFLIPVSNLDGLADSPVKHLKIAENLKIFKYSYLDWPMNSAIFIFENLKL